MNFENENPFKGNLLPFIRVGIGISCVLFLSVIVSRIVYPFGSGPWEAFNWMPATHLLEGKNPYGFAFTPPYGMSPYGIVFYALIAVGVKLFGFQLWFGKILSVLAFAVCVFFTGKITRQITQSREAVWFVCLAALAMFPSQMWIAIVRSDLIAAAFALAAVYVALTLRKDKNRVRIAGIALLAAAAFFTKQTLLLPPAIVFLRFLQLKKWREAVGFAAAFAILIGSGIWLLNYTSNGGYLWQHFFHAEKLPLNLSQSVNILVGMLKEPTFFFSIIFLIVFAYKNRAFLRETSRGDVTKILCSPKFLILIYLLLSLGWAFISSGRQGGNHNYYIENTFVVAIFCAIVYENFRQNLAPKWTLAMIVLLTFGGAFQFVRVLRGEYFRWQAQSYYREIFETTGKFTPPGSKCISVYPELVVWNGCEFNFDDFEEYDGGWTPELRAIFEREINAGNYAAIVWYDDKLQSQFPKYRLVPMSQKLPERYFPVYLYVRDSK